MKKLMMFLFLFILMSVSVLSFTYTSSNFVNYWSMDYSNTSSTKIGDAKGIQDLTINGVITRNVSGKANESILFAGVSTSYLSGASDTLKLGNKTITGWIKRNSVTTFDTIIFEGTDGSCTTSFMLYIQGDSDDAICICTGGLSIKSNTSTLNNTWYHFAVTLNSSSNCLRLYINGLENATTDCVGLEANYTSFRVSGNTYPLHAYLDELTYFNQSLSSADIYEIYILGLNSHRLDFIASSVLTYPTNQTIYNNFNGSVIITSDDNISCSINNTLFQTINTEPNLIHHYKNTTLPDGNYSLYVNCSSGNNVSFWFVKDTTPPSITINSPVTNSSFYVGNYTINFTASDTFSLWEINAYISNGTLNETITNISINTSVTEYNYSKLIDFNTSGVFYFNYTISDAHTDLDISDKLNNMVELPYKTDYESGIYTTLDNTNFLIKYPKSIELKSEKTLSAINYIFKNVEDEKDTWYSLESSNYISYLKNSKYPCHFIINNIWHDCNGLTNPKVEKISDYKYIIHHELGKNEEVLEKSTGILNTISFSGFYNITINETIIVNDTNDTNTTNTTIPTNFTIIINNNIDTGNDDTSITNVYWTFGFLFLLYILMFWISASLNTKYGLVFTFVTGIFLGSYFINMVSSGYSVVGVLFIIINLVFFITAIATKK